jgi:hypothetical protein
MYVCIFLASNLESLYAGAFFQFTIGLIERLLCVLLQGLLWLGLWDLGWRISIYHFKCIICWHSFTVFLTSRCILLVMSLLAMVKLLFAMNLLILSLYSSWYKIIIELPLSVLEIMDLFLFSLSFIWFITLFSLFACLLPCVGFWLCCL